MNKIDDKIQKTIDKLVKKLTENRIMFRSKNMKVYEKEIQPLVGKICCAIHGCKRIFVHIWPNKNNVEGRFDYFGYKGQIIFPTDLYWDTEDNLKIVLILNGKKDKFEARKIKLKDFTIDKLIKTFEKMKNKLEKKSE